jgi:hypothetical protein
MAGLWCALVAILLAPPVVFLLAFIPVAFVYQDLQRLAFVGCNVRPVQMKVFDIPFKL